MKLYILIFIIFLQVNNVFADEMEEKIKEFILENPEIILKSLENYEIQLEKKQNLESKKKIIKYKSDILILQMAFTVEMKNHKPQLLSFLITIVLIARKRIRIF